MNKRISFVVLCTVLVGMMSVAAAHTAKGEEPNIITDDQIATIKMHCTDLQANLNRLHQTDILLRYNRGELYRTIADKLMVPLNQRAASNQLDGSSLVQVTAAYNTAYQTFFDAYKNYETSLSSAIAIDCNRQPTTFYDQVADARIKRVKLHAANSRLVELAVEYRSDFTEFRKTTAALKVAQ